MPDARFILLRFVDAYDLVIMTDVTCWQIRRGVFQKHWLLAHLLDEPRHPGFYLVALLSSCLLKLAADVVRLMAPYITADV